jgi:hypothetical protein
MKRISRRLFLLMMLSACAPVAPNRQIPPTQPPFHRPIPNELTPIGQIPVQQVPSFLPQPTMTPAPTQESTPVPLNMVIPSSDTTCNKPITYPAAPTVIPFPGDIDTATGRHMMGTVPEPFDLTKFCLEVTGLVDHPLQLTMNDLFCLPKMTETVTTTCYAFQDTATWSGVLISDVLKMAGVKPEAQKVIQKGADGASRAIKLEMALDGHNFLAYQMGENPLPILFGFPLRSIIIDVAGQYSVKWLTSLEIA